MKVIALVLLPDNRTLPGMAIELADPVARLFLARGLVRIPDERDEDRSRKRRYFRRDLEAEE